MNAFFCPKVIWLIVMTPIVFMGCKKQQKQRMKQVSIDTRREESVSSLELVQRVKEIEACLYDVPTPLNILPIAQYCSISDNENTQAITLGYSSSMDTFDLINFYKQHMEYEGWYLMGHSENNPVFLMYTKPERYCQICLLSESTRQSTIILSTGLRLDTPYALD